MTGDSQAKNDFSAVYFTAERTDVLREWSLGGGRVEGWLHACACRLWPSYNKWHMRLVGVPGKGPVPLNAN